MAAHTGASCLLRIPRCETGCDACSHKSAKSAENIELPYLWLRNDGGTEPDGGTPFRSPGPHTLPWEGSADHFSEACPASGLKSSGKITLQLITGKLN